MRNKKLVPAVRVDGANRINLAEKRRRRKANNAVPAPPREDTRVSDTWRREELRALHEAETAPRRRLGAKLLRDGGGKDGTKLVKVKVKISSERSERQIVRCRPGTFEWRYGRNKQDALFHAGNHFARLWELAGTAAACAPSMESASGAAWRGMPDGRVAAIDVLNAASSELGKLPLSRLIDYCVHGLTSAEIARKHGQKERDMAPVLHQDLRACAIHFLYL